MTSTGESTENPWCILVEDDEEAIREVVTSMLTGGGYGCRVAETPTQILEIVESWERIDLVCCGVKERPDDSLKSLIGKTSWRSIPVHRFYATLDLTLMP